MGQTFIQYLNESSLSRLWRKYKEFDSGTITAFRGSKDIKTNLKNNLELKTELIRRGYSVTAIDGVYIENYGKPNAQEVREKSFIVFDVNGNGKLRKDLEELGNKYDQDSITYSCAATGEYYLIGTNKTGYPGMGVEVKLGKPMFGKSGEFHSKIKNRPFVFEGISQGIDDWDAQLTKYNISRIRSVKMSSDYVLPE